jgi:Microtubule-binding stalk of dynein motor
MEGICYISAPWFRAPFIQCKMHHNTPCSCHAGKLQPVLDEKAQNTQALLAQVASDKEQADIVKAVVEHEAAEVAEVQKQVKAIADDAKADLAEALPVLESAVKSLSALNKNDIVEMKSFSKPPALVMLTMEAVCTLKQEKPDWEAAKKLLGASVSGMRIFLLMSNQGVCSLLSAH